MKKLIRFFLQGLLYITPLAVTIYVIVLAVSWMDGLIMDLNVFSQGVLSDYDFPGLGLAIILVLVTLIGFIGQRMISSPAYNIYSKLINKAPLVKIIYSSVKDLMSAFVGKEKKFDKPVLVTMDENGVLQRLGFITNTDLSDLGVKDKVGVYLPSSYGMLGEFYIIPTSKVTLVNAPSADVMKFIVSGGVTKVKEGDS